MDGQFGRPAGRRSRTAAIAVGATLALGVLSAPAWATIVPEYDPDAVAGAIVDNPSTLDTAGTDWHELATPVPTATPAPEEPPEPFPAAVSEAPLGAFPTSSTSYAILATGDVASADLPNDEGGTSYVFDLGTPDTDDLFQTDNGALHGNTDNDVTVLKVAVVVPDGMNCVTLDYRFLSEEFPEYVNEDYNDAFIAEIDNLSWTTTDNVISHAGDFATAPNGAPVSVDGVGGVAATPEEAQGTTYDGATGRVTTKNPITPGPHVIYLSIFDQGDSVWDSAVMLDRLAFINEAPSTCKPPEVPVIVPPPPPPPAAPGPPPPPPPPPNDITVPGSSVAFYSNGTFPVAVTVPAPGVLNLSQAAAATTSRATVAATKKLVKRATKTVTAAGKVKVKMRLTKKGKKVLRKKGKLKVRLAVTFTPTGGTANTEFTKVTIKKKRR